VAGAHMHIIFSNSLVLANGMHNFINTLIKFYVGRGALTLACFEDNIVILSCQAKKQ
jgi:hypothetical protein